jgi:hypothetical protein
MDNIKERYISEMCMKHWLIRKWFGLICDVSEHPEVHCRSRSIKNFPYDGDLMCGSMALQRLWEFSLKVEWVKCKYE